MNISITEVDGRIHLIGPFDRPAPAPTEFLGGHRNAVAKARAFDPRGREKVAELAVGAYGALVTLQLPTSEFSEYRTVTVAGRIVLEKQHRDTQPSLGAGVILLSGQFPSSSGSAEYPTFGANDAVIEIKGVPTAAAADWVIWGDAVIVSQETEVEVDGLTA